MRSCRIAEATATFCEREIMPMHRLPTRKSPPIAIKITIVAMTVSTKVKPAGRMVPDANKGGVRRGANVRGRLA
jgi:hypothetical protein